MNFEDISIIDNIPIVIFFLDQCLNPFGIFIILVDWFRWLSYNFTQKMLISRIMIGFIIKLVIEQLSIINCAEFDFKIIYFNLL